MTKAFLEPMILNQENEKLVLEAFSNKNIKKLKAFNLKRKLRTKRKISTKRKLTVAELF